ncbi:MAG: hypothetical protein KDN18_10130 [Verrucomicrobiae bacterium]|nr:hypothetical protein [Verrucomicrobiae bacterium]
MRSDPEALELVGRYLDGQATAEEVARLEALMKDDLRLRSEFLACARVDASLRSAMGGNPVPLAKSLASDSRNRFAWRWWGSVAAAAALVVGIVSWHSGIRVQLGVPGAVARFGELDSCRWMDPATRVLGGDAIVPGQRVELSAGRAELHFATGARVTMKGPAIFEVRSDKGGFLALGEVQVAAETAESKGFVVVTPSSKFVDIGTAFSAGVTADGLSRLDVSEGIVDVILDGTGKTQRLRAGETMFVEPGDRKILTRIEAGDGTSSFRFPSIPPPSMDDAADRSQGRANIRVVRGSLGQESGRLGGAAEALLDGSGQSKQDSPRESVYFSAESGGAFEIDLGESMSVTRILSYSWHQHESIPEHRERAKQRFTLYGWAGSELPDPESESLGENWIRVARVNTDESLHVVSRLDRPAQQACSITAEKGEIGRYRYLRWEVKGGTFYGEIDVFAEP